MKQLHPLGQPLGSDDFTPWVRRSLESIERYLADDIAAVADAYTISGTFTETRTLNPATATVTDLANVLATLIQDLKGRGSKTDLSQQRGLV